jgi:hypothetical protein
VLTALGALFLLALPLAMRERAALLTLSERPLLARPAGAGGNWGEADYVTLGRGHAPRPAWPA